MLHDLTPRPGAPAYERAMTYRENFWRARQRAALLTQARDAEHRLPLKRALGLAAATHRQQSATWYVLAVSTELNCPEARAFRRASEELVDPYRETILFPEPAP